MSLIDLDVQVVGFHTGVAILSDGQEVPITNWIGDDGGECEPSDAVSCVAGPDFDGEWYAVDLSQFAKATIQ